MNRKLIGLLTIFLALIASPAFSLDEPLPANQAFAFDAEVLPDHTLEFIWQIAPGYYLYKDKVHITNADNSSVLQAANLPPAIKHHDPELGDSIVYAKQLIIRIPWQDSFSNNSLLVSYQGCAENGFCYAPINHQIYIDAAYKIQRQPSSATSFEHASKTDFNTVIHQQFLPLTIAVFFGFGLLLAFSPCVLPMLPLIFNLIIGAKPIRTRRAVLLSSCYVLGMALSYAIAGLFIGFLGAALQAWLQQPLILFSLSLILVLLALQQFGLINFKIPHFNKRVHAWGERQAQGSLIGALILGVLAALIISPCITPPVIGALTYISQDGNPLIGAIVLFTFALGMGTPLILLALLSSMVLPKAGRWMNWIKYATGIALLILAVVLVMRAIPEHYFRPPPVSIQWQTVSSTKQLQAALREAHSKNQITMVEFYATWCTYCVQMEHEVFSNSEVQAQLANFKLLLVDITNISPEQNVLLHSLQVYGPPTTLFFAVDGKEIKSKRIVGAMTAQELLELLGP